MPLAVALMSIAVSATAAEAISGDLIVFHAGSLAVPFKQIAEAFAKEYPGVRVMREAAGSRACARKIAELNQPCDVMASADYTVIDSLLIPEHADWNVRFATNEMAVVYWEMSRHADEITSANWYMILAMGDVAFGRSDPDADPCGYRTVLTLRLAEKHYGREGLADRLLAKDVRYIRPKETDLLALLEVREIDYIFLYRSVAEQHHLKYVTLPDAINLKNPDYADFYKTATVEVSGKRPDEKLTKVGAPIVYGVTIPKNAPNPEAALAFVAFLLKKDQGMAIMKKNGQEPLVPSPCDRFDALPAMLQRYARREQPR